MRKVFFLVLPALILTLLHSCKLPESAYSKKTKSAGKKHEIMVVMDSLQWKGIVGMAVRKMLQEPIAGLSPTEPKFKLLHIKPHHFDGFIRKHRNIIIVASFDDTSTGAQRIQSYFSKGAKEKIKANPKLYKYTSKDRYAVDQNLMYLFGKDQKTLINNISQHKNAILNFFYKAEVQRTRAKIITNKSSIQLSDYIDQKIGLKYTIPQGFIVIDSLASDTSTVWIGSKNGNIIQNMFVTSKTYTGKKDFAVDNILKWRQQLGKDYIHAKADSSFLTHQPEIDVTQEIVPNDQYYIIRYRGLWKLNKTFKGGPFIAYAFIDNQKRNRIYYSEIYTMAVGQKRRPLLFYAEAILSSALTDAESSK